MAQEKDSTFKLNIGGPSIILLLTVLGLSLFAVLSVRAAYNGLKLAETSKQALEAYYKAEGEAQRAEFEIREALERGASPEEIAAFDGVTEADEEVISCEIYVSDISFISLKIAGAGAEAPASVLEHRLTVEQQSGYDGSGFGDMSPIEIVF